MKTGSRPNSPQRANQRFSAEARQTAIKRLIARHTDEFDVMHDEERTKRGLPTVTATNDVDSLKREIRRLRRQLDERGL